MWSDPRVADGGGDIGRPAPPGAARLVSIDPVKETEVGSVGRVLLVSLLLFDTGAAVLLVFWDNSPCMSLWSTFLSTCSTLPPSFEAFEILSSNGSRSVTASII